MNCSTDFHGLLDGLLDRSSLGLLDGVLLGLLDVLLGGSSLGLLDGILLGLLDRLLDGLSLCAFAWPFAHVRKGLSAEGCALPYVRARASP